MIDQRSIALATNHLTNTAHSDSDILEKTSRGIQTEAAIDIVHLSIFCALLLILMVPSIVMAAFANMQGRLESKNASAMTLIAKARLNTRLKGKLMPTSIIHKTARLTKAGTKFILLGIRRPLKTDLK